MEKEIMMRIMQIDIEIGLLTKNMKQKKKIVIQNQIIIVQKNIKIMKA